MGRSGAGHGRRAPEAAPEPREKLQVLVLTLVATQQGIGQQQQRHHRMKPYPPDPRRARNHLWMVAHGRG